MLFSHHCAVVARRSSLWMLKRLMEIDIVITYGSALAEFPRGIRRWTGFASATIVMAFEVEEENEGESGDPVDRLVELVIAQVDGLSTFLGRSSLPTWPMSK